MSNHRFEVVEFSDGLAVVPQTWLNEERSACKWPNYTNQVHINKSIIRMMEPQRDWMNYKVIKVYGSSDSYTMALDLLKTAEHESEAEKLIQDADYSKKTRFSRARKDSSSSAESFRQQSSQPGRRSKLKNADLPRWPQGSGFLNESKILEDSFNKKPLDDQKLRSYLLSPISESTSQTITKNTDTTVPQNGNCVIFGTSNSDNYLNIGLSDNECDPIKEKSSDPIQREESQIDRISMNDNMLTLDTSDVAVSQGAETSTFSKKKVKSGIDEKIQHASQTSIKRILDNTTHDSELTLAFLKEIIFMCNKVHIEITELRKDMKSGISRESSSRTKIDINLHKILPFRTMEDLMEFNTKIETNQDLLNAIVDILSNAGGKEDRVKVNNMLEKLMTDNVGSRFSRKGQKGKKSFEKLKLGIAVIDAMLNCKTNFKESDVKIQIGNWFAGRKAKLDRKSKNSEKKSLACSEDTHEKPTKTTDKLKNFDKYGESSCIQLQIKRQ